MAIPRHQGSRDLFYPPPSQNPKIPENFQPACYQYVTSISSKAEKHRGELSETCGCLNQNMSMFGSIHRDVFAETPACMILNVPMMQKTAAKAESKRKRQARFYLQKGNSQGHKKKNRTNSPPSHPPCPSIPLLFPKRLSLFFCYLHR